MRLPSAIVFCLVGLCSLAVAVACLDGCALLQSHEAKVVERQVLTDVQIGCVLTHELLQAPVIETACAIEHGLAPVIEALLAAHRAAVRRGMQARAVTIFGRELAEYDAGGDAK